VSVPSEGLNLPIRRTRMPRPAWQDPTPVQALLPGAAEMGLVPGSLPSLADALAAVPEHRHPRGFKVHQPPYPLIPMLLLLLVGILRGYRGYQSIADWARVCAREYPDVLDTLGFPAGRHPRTPVAATLFRLVRDLDLVPFQAALEGWLVATATALEVGLPSRGQSAAPTDQICADGKAVRGAARRRRAELHLLSFYVPALEIVLAQVDCGAKGREGATAAMLLGRLPLKGRVFTADAALTQRDVCQTILDGEGSYLLPAKDNQRALLTDIQEAFSPSALR
jgi:hypothetical protein